MDRVLIVPPDEDEAVFTAAADPAHPLIGAWTASREGNTVVVWILPDGSFVMAEDGPSGDPTGQPGMEAGLWTWNSGTGAFSRAITADTTGAWGLSHLPGGLTVTVAGDVMTLVVPGEGSFPFSRIAQAANSIRGAWYTFEGGQAGGTVGLAFLATGQYFMVQDGSSIADPSGQDGMERGTYAWNATTGAFAATTTVDTNGQWGLSHGVPPTLLVALGGGSGNDAVQGTNAAEVLHGFGGDDTLDGLGGNDTLHGGDGFDMAVFTGNLADNRIELGDEDGEFIVHGPDGVDVLTGIEALEFEDGVFVVGEASEEDDEIEGTESGDVLRGRGGDDYLDGGGGDDALYGDDGDDEIEGGEGDDLLDGGSGNDTLEGDEGNDTYVVDSAGDVVEEPDSIDASLPGGPGHQVGLGGGVDRVIASIDYALGNAIEHLELAGTGNIAAAGNALPNRLTGNAGSNVLEGGAGNDTLDGGAGIDTAVYAGSRAQYTFTPGSVNANASGEGMDSLANVERLDFSDVSVALDVQGSGNAAIVAKVLGSVFGTGAVSNEVYAGIGLALVDGGMGYDAVMRLALDVVLGPGASNEQVVTLLYTNVIGSAPDAATRDSFVDLIEAGYFTQATLAVLAADFMGVPLAAQAGLEYV